MEKNTQLSMILRGMVLTGTMALCWPMQGQASGSWPSQGTATTLNVAAAKTNGVDAIQQAGNVVKGNITDETGEPLIGATVSLGNGKGTVTDLDGNFTLKDVPAGATITISYVGYKDLVVKADSKKEFNIQLEPDNKVLDDVVVIGYGVQKKSNVTGAISSIKSDDFKNSTITNAASALQGRVSGVQVVNSTGAPGSAPTIRIRGYSSNGSSDPLYIVDGLKVSDISYLDPSSIQSMEVLKDAATAAIYGAEAGNGVVLITTKNGNKGKTSITFDAQWTFSSQAKKVKMMNAEQYTNFYTEGLGDGFTSLYDLYNISGTDTDWQDEMYETGKMQKYNLGISGGNEQGTFYVGLGWNNNDGMVVMKNDYYRRLTGQINATYNIRPWLEVGTSNTIMGSSSNTISESDNTMATAMSSILNMDPLTPVYYTDSNLPTRIKNGLANGLHYIHNDAGQYFGYSWAQDSSNPMMNVYLNKQKYRTSMLNGSTYLNIKPIKGLVFTSRLGYTIGSVNSGEYLPPRITGYFSDTDTDTRLKDVTYATRYWQWENFANYVLNTKTAGNFSIMAGMSYSRYTQDYSGGQTNAISNDAPNFHYLNYSTNGADDYVIGDKPKRVQIAYYGRLSWDFLDRYNAQFNFRADSYDAAYLDLDHNWGYFPSASIGWTFTNEEFMKNITGKGFTFGKLRASYGVNGSISNLGGYMYAANLKSGFYDTNHMIGNMNYYIDGKLHGGIYPSSALANPKLRWERSKQFDVGLDLRFLNDRLTFTGDYYYKLTDGLLVQSVAPLITGTSTQYQNLGKVTNKGLEIELEWRDNIGDFKYGIKGNISTVSNNVKEYKGKGTRIEGSSLLRSSSALTYFEEGYPLWYIRGYKFTGVNAQTGEAEYEDANNDGQITDADKVNLGSAIPDFTYGITLTAAYKGFDFMAYGTGVSGNKIVYGLMSTDVKSRANRPTFLYDGRWTSATATTASMPSATYQINDTRFYNSSAFVFSGAFFKVKQIQLGYTLPKSVVKKIYLENLRAYVSLDNFFTITNYKGSDPEVHGSSSSMPIDYGGYPMSKSISFGFNISL